MFYVYILESSTGGWYYGYTERPSERLAEHNSNNGHFTGGKGPWKMIFLRSFNEKTEALQFENKLKKLKNKVYIKREYGKYFIS